MNDDIEKLKTANSNLLSAIEKLGRKIIELEELGDEIVEAVKYGSDEDLYKFVARWESLRCIEEDTYPTSIANDTNLPFPDCGRLPE